MRLKTAFQYVKHLKSSIRTAFQNARRSRTLFQNIVYFRYIYSNFRFIFGNFWFIYGYSRFNYFYFRFISGQIPLLSVTCDVIHEKKMHVGY